MKKKDFLNAENIAKEIPIAITKNKYVIVLVHSKHVEYQIKECDTVLKLKEFLIEMLLEDYGDDEEFENIDNQYSLVELIKLCIQLTNLDLDDNEWTIASIVDVNKGLTYKVDR